MPELNILCVAGWEIMGKRPIDPYPLPLGLAVLGLKVLTAISSVHILSKRVENKEFCLVFA